ncbi:hypothetical protein, partial [Streptosporangium sp. OZ121]|uniref:hypothetical protein n=1 Tax=Streptosporangium sp. OZ121 TaxID=3444183 RepID=UPI003F7AED9D
MSESAVLRGLQDAVRIGVAVFIGLKSAYRGQSLIRQWGRGGRKALAGCVASLVGASLLVGVSVSPALADAVRPGNAAALLAQAPGAVELGGGAGQAGRSGDYTHSYPFEVPPARKGRTPGVGLVYSSGAST